MKPVFSTYNSNTIQKGFSLLELMVVVSVLAAVAFISTGAYENVHERTGEQLVHVEMQEIAKAIRQFKQDTGYYPKTGPFNLDSVPGGKIPNARIDICAIPETPGLPVNSGNGGGGAVENSARAFWFYSPANFYQLFINPLKYTSHQLENWNPETGRGWRGPYLNGLGGEGYVDIGSGINNGTSKGNPSGTPLSGVNNIPDVSGIADPFEHRAEGVVLDWSTTYRPPVPVIACLPPPPPRSELTRWGRPYLLFDIDTKPYLVSMGPDGMFDIMTNSNSDDIRLNIE